MRGIDPDDMILVPYGDSSWANAPGDRSQAGLLIVATDRRALEETRPGSILEWKSNRFPRQTRSTLGAEAGACDIAVDHASFISAFLSEMMYPDFRATAGETGRVPVIPVTDCKSLYDAVRRLSTSLKEKRVQIDVTSIRETASRNIRWVPTLAMLADGLTKRCPKLRNLLREIMMDPQVTLVEREPVADPDHVFLVDGEEFTIRALGKALAAFDPTGKEGDGPHRIDKEESAPPWRQRLDISDEPTPVEVAAKAAAKAVLRAAPKTPPRAPVVAAAREPPPPPSQSAIGVAEHASFGRDADGDYVM